MHMEQTFTIDILLMPLEVGNWHENKALVLINDQGKEALLQSNVLPKYKQLCYLQSHNKLTMAVSPTQATCYIFEVISYASQAFKCDFY